MQKFLEIAKSVSILALASVLSLPSVFAATASVSTNQSAYYLSSGESLSLSGSIQAGPDAGTLVDIYIQVQINSGVPVFYLGPTLGWGTAVVPIVQRFPLVNVSAPSFYNTGVVAGLPTGSYQFSVIVVRAGLDPTNNANRLAYGATTVAINPQPPPGTTVMFNPPATLKGTVGTPFQFDFSPFAAGGSSPYHFQKDTGGGFPPMGLILAPNGVLSGTPSIAGTSTTSVCAVDLGGHQKCINGAISIAAAAAADGAFSVAIQAASCNYLRTEYSTRYYEIVASGTASGGIGAEWAVGTNPSFADTTQFTCGSWTATPRLQMCKRGANDPETITWTARFAELWSGTTFYARNGEVDLTARVCKYSDGTGCYTAAYATAKCP